MEQLTRWKNKIALPDASAAAEAMERWDSIAKPLDGMGELERIIVKIAAMEWLMQQEDRYYEWLPANGEGYELEVTDGSITDFLSGTGHPASRILRKLSFGRAGSTI